MPHRKLESKIHQLQRALSRWDNEGELDGHKIANAGDA